MFEVLDRIAAKENRTKASRALATIADLLGLLAGPEGGLRSGPASNIEWLHAFHLLEVIPIFTCLNDDKSLLFCKFYRMSQ